MKPLVPIFTDYQGLMTNAIEVTNKFNKIKELVGSENVEEVKRIDNEYKKYE